MTSVEIVNYKAVPQDVYLTLDLEYLSFDSRPKDYLKTEFTSLLGIPCGPVSMCKFSRYTYACTYGEGLSADKMFRYESARYKVQKNLHLVHLSKSPVVDRID